jgi:hypothetical protein
MFGTKPVLRTRVIVATLLVFALSLFAGLAWATDTLVVQESFTPDRLGAPTNLSVTAHFASTSGKVPSPVTRLTLYAPAGLTVDTRYAGACGQTKLEQGGPAACPPNSRAGFGGGVAELEFPHETVRERFTVDFFFATTHGPLKLLAYASGTSPVNVELVVIAKQVPTPKPYGLGFAVEVPPINTIPGVSSVSIESAFATFGAANVAYYERVHNKRTLVHLRGMVVPKHCPAGGFPTKATMNFADGTTLTVNPTVPCPHGK